ncbi:MAG: GAF domain-containing protein [Fimbriimonadaceae bacterium]
MSLGAFQEMLVRVAREPDCDAALDLLTQSAIELAGGRNAMIARMNDAEGRLELKHGAGPEWSQAETDISLSIGTKEGIVSYVAATGATVLSGNVREEPRYKNLFGTTRSEVAVPISGEGGRLRAVLNVESDRLDAFEEEHRIACEAIASVAAMVIDRQDGVAREEALVQVGLALDTALTEEDLISQVMRVAGEVLRFQACSIFLLERETDTFVLRGSVGRLKDQIGELRYKRGEGCTGWVCECGELVNLDNPMGDPRWRGKYVEFPSEEIAHFLAVPVVSRGKCIGAIRVIRRVTENPYLDNRFTESDIRVLQSIAEQVGTGLENIRNVEKMVRSERMIAWGELSAKSSHMIGNRVFALKGDVNELGHLVKEPEPEIEELRAIQKSLWKNVMRVEEILQDFRDFLTATQIKREPADLNAIVKETVEEVFPRRGKVALELEFADGLPLVMMDSAKIGRAISELIENSMHYIDKGRLRVATGLAEEADRRLGRAPAGKRYVKIEIEDTGPGVVDEQKEQIFQPFYSGRVKGMGLGLSIVKGIVDAHGGGVFEAGEVGNGAKFVILLPVSERP